jgi:hypothetical protein
MQERSRSILLQGAFVRREHELLELRQGLTEVRAGAGRLFLIIWRLFAKTLSQAPKTGACAYYDEQIAWSHFDVWFRHKGHGVRTAL